MHVVGYVRERPGSDSVDTAFMQAERIRIWVARNGYDLISICQDNATSAEREGFGAVLGIISSGQAELVVVPTLEALSPDKITQEVMLFELRKTGISVASTEEHDLPALSVPPTDPARMLIRDVLDKAAAFRVDRSSAPTELIAVPEVESELVPVVLVPDVIVEFVESLPTTEPDPDRALA
ncbi:MAG: recombinase family protein [Acidimicrobiia bacterium]|nr:recombinase family protein [Acidimicrobiia bacterium]